MLRGFWLPAGKSAFTCASQIWAVHPSSVRRGHAPEHASTPSGGHGRCARGNSGVDCRRSAQPLNGASAVGLRTACSRPSRRRRLPSAHRAGLLLGPYTFRNENSFLPANFQRGTNPADYGDAIAEYTLFFSIGVDGLFSHNADTAVTARTLWIAEGRPHVAA